MLSENIKKKVENFEVNIDHTYNEKENIENLMSYSENKKKKHDKSIKLKKVDNKIKRSFEYVKFFKSIWI